MQICKQKVFSTAPQNLNRLSDIYLLSSGDAAHSVWPPRQGGTHARS